MSASLKSFKTVDEYIKATPKKVQKLLKEIRRTIKRTVPQTIEAISYQMPTFKLNNKNLVHFAAFKNHIGFYPSPSGIRAFEKDLQPYKSGKGSIQFPLDEVIPYDLIQKIVEYRIKEVERNLKVNN
ncbi:MAG: DUF1801 domain-containing protein [Verrucomicrobiae bacterium]|nr:DUF1801 domain-containing protein [Verrucomicrobiae bacterium]